MSTKNTTETAAKRDVTKLQRAIVDGLEDVKAQDIKVFNTEQLSPLFERVIVASGTSNRQTKALASSVIDSVREAGFDKPRVEGEENGEWIIVDCGPAVVHIMQPVIRQYYRLEEIWGEKPVRMRIGAPKPTPAEKAEAATKKPRTTKKAVDAEGAKTLTPKAAAKESAKSAPAAKKAPAKKSAASGTAAPRKRAASKTAADSANLKKVVVNAPKKPAAKKASAARKKAV